MAETIRVQVLFTKETPKGTFTDALYYTQEEFAELKDGDKEAAQQARADAWVDSIVNAPAPVEQSLEQLEQDKATLEKYLADINVKIAEKG